MSSDPVTHKLVSFAAISLAIKKKDVFLSTWIEKAAWVCGEKVGAKKKQKKPTVPKKIYKKFLYTELFNQKVRGGDSGSSDKALLSGIQNGPSTYSQHLETESSTEKTSLGITTESVWERVV